jgi:hypothetical protein
MWDGVTYVDPTRDPIIYEGLALAKVVVTNAGPFAVSLRGWSSYQPAAAVNPDINIQLWPGNSGSISANLVRARLLDTVSMSAVGVPRPTAGFAAIGWRILP